MKNASEIRISAHTLTFICLGLLAFLSRILPHPPGIIAFTSFCLLLGHSRVSIREVLPSLLILLISVLISDLTLKFITPFSLISSWLAFSYTGYIALFSLGYIYRAKRSILSITSLLASGALLYWLWTNLGVWLSSGMYAHTIQGIIQCYTAALPFLRNALIGDVLFGGLMVMLQQLLLSWFYRLQTHSPSRGSLAQTTVNLSPTYASKYLVWLSPPSGHSLPSVQTFTE